MEKWTEWSEGQVELFNILGRVCAGVGGEGASGMFILLFRLVYYFCCLGSLGFSYWCVL
jgi:hypothetical protein